MSKNINIPMVTDLVAAGDPKLKAAAQKSRLTHIDELNLRIDELENAIGQDKSGPIGRAYAIRAEAGSSNNTPSPQKIINRNNMNKITPTLKKERL